MSESEQLEQYMAALQAVHRAQDRVLGPMSALRAMSGQIATKEGLQRVRVQTEICAAMLRGLLRVCEKALQISNEHGGFGTKGQDVLAKIQADMSASLAEVGELLDAYERRAKGWKA